MASWTYIVVLVLGKDTLFVSTPVITSRRGVSLPSLVSRVSVLPRTNEESKPFNVAPSLPVPVLNLSLEVE